MKTALRIAVLLLFCRVSNGQDIPAPPKQGQPWTAPATELPDVMVSAATALFEDGMADPRGCEYREVEYDFGQPEKEHGWVLPTGGGERRYAIGWDGVVYPVKTIGKPADLAADLAPLTGRPAGRDRIWSRDAISFSARVGSRIKVALLLRLGEKSLAETLWRTGSVTRDEAKADPFVGIAATWLGQWYVEAERVYLSGDYPAALTICRRLAEAVDKASASARTRGDTEPLPDRKYGVGFWQLPVLTAECQRRLGQPMYVSVLELGQAVPGPARVDALIQELDQVRVFQRMNPGETDVRDAPVVQALVEGGDAAVPALLKCLVEDRRLTRSEYTAGMGGHGPIIPVYEAAYRALFNILDKTFPLFEHEDETSRPWNEPRNLSAADRQALAVRLEAYWHKIRSEDPVENAYATLADEHAKTSAWMQAIDDIVQPATGGFTDYRLVWPNGGNYSLVTDRFTPRGEKLRDGREPSVSDLIIRRFGQVASSAGDDSIQMDRPREYRARDWLPKLLLSLTDWDGKAHVDDLRRLQNELVGQLERSMADPGERRQAEGTWYHDAAMLVRVYERRMGLGDPWAMTDYCDFLETIKPDKLGTAGGSGYEFFRPMWRRPDDPTIKAAAEWLFGIGSPWIPLVWRDRHDLSELILTPLIALPPFARELERGLKDNSITGSVTLKEDGTFDRTSRVYTLDLLAPPAGTTVDYRLCDLYANKLSEVIGFPECELYWPEVDRDWAVLACRNFLHRHADQFRYRAEDKDRDGPHTYPAWQRIHFPLLDHPATAQDVEEGRAIFTLPTPSRLVHLTGLPLVVNRPDHPVNPRKASRSDGKQVVSYETQGGVWQVEETLVDGRWERFYGFVGSYQMEKVPAAEIAFEREQGTDITSGISGRIETPRRPVSDHSLIGFYDSPFVAAGAAVPIKVNVHNHTGLDQTLPEGMVLPPGTGKRLPDGIGLVLEYSEKIQAERGEYPAPKFDYGAWQTVPMRSDVEGGAKADAGPTMSPGQHVALLDFDLRDYFKLGVPGTYRLRATFRVPGQADRASNEIVFAIAS